MKREIIAGLLAAAFAVFIFAGIKLRRPAATRGIAANLCISCMGLKSKNDK